MKVYLGCLINNSIVSIVLKVDSMLKASNSRIFLKWFVQIVLKVESPMMNLSLSSPKMLKNACFNKNHDISLFSHLCFNGYTIIWVNTRFERNHAFRFSAIGNVKGKKDLS